MSKPARPADPVEDRAASKEIFRCIRARAVTLRDFDRRIQIPFGASEILIFAVFRLRIRVPFASWMMRATRKRDPRRSLERKLFRGDQKHD
jgi:hypothetical protein